MKKERISRGLPFLKIVLLIVGILLIATIIYKVYQVKDFQKDLRPITEEEKQQIVTILNANTNITCSDIIFGNVIMGVHATLVQVQVKDGRFKKTYLINLDKNNLVRKYDEK